MIAQKIHAFASAINVMCSTNSPVLEVVMAMRKYADDLAAGKAVKPDAIANQIVNEWIEAGRLPPVSSDFRGLVAEGIRRAVGERK